MSRYPDTSTTSLVGGIGTSTIVVTRVVALRAVGPAAGSALAAAPAAAVAALAVVLGTALLAALLTAAAADRHPGGRCGAAAVGLGGRAAEAVVGGHRRVVVRPVGLGAGGLAQRQLPFGERLAVVAQHGLRVGGRCCGGGAAGGATTVSSGSSTSAISRPATGAASSTCAASSPFVPLPFTVATPAPLAAAGASTGRDTPPVVSRICPMMSDFLVRALAFTPSALAIARSWSLSLDSRTDCSSASAATSASSSVRRRGRQTRGRCPKLSRLRTGAVAPRNLESHPCSTFGGTWNGVLPGNPGAPTIPTRWGAGKHPRRVGCHVRAARPSRAVPGGRLTVASVLDRIGGMTAWRSRRT